MLVHEWNYDCLGVDLCLFRNGIMLVQELINACLGVNQGTGDS